MSNRTESSIVITKSEGYIPSARTAAALEALAVSLAEDAEDDTVGFGRDPNQPVLGNAFNREAFSASIVRPGPLQFCAGLHLKDGDDDYCAGIFW